MEEPEQEGAETPQEEPDRELTLNGVTIPKVNTIRILGLNYQGDGAGTTTFQRLVEAVSQVTHLVRRVASREHGPYGQYSLGLVQDLVVSRITYGTPYLGLRKSEKEKINELIRKTYKLELRLSEQPRQRGSCISGSTICGGERYRPTKQANRKDSNLWTRSEPRCKD
ncbi:hypothetical protein IscW_ISCW018667 [Ixodes scapularis]|uniref:Uncharacterized protein n=1 Tax=Ixodes scapularis TaxID=6945 RepID=B7PQL6_IXOSC|nr:hypothetical protein IscW_ISCW018667 [Ixodes scapularis]|eukprot:XP_002436056.1 hypothetical protein IscW_ISCW018667 [Ixodes scapularis]